MVHVNLVISRPIEFWYTALHGRTYTVEWEHYGEDSYVVEIV
jgi:hypothetical protein